MGINIDENPKKTTLTFTSEDFIENILDMLGAKEDSHYTLIVGHPCSLDGLSNDYTKLAVYHNNSTKNAPSFYESIQGHRYKNILVLYPDFEEACLSFNVDPLGILDWFDGHCSQLVVLK